EVVGPADQVEQLKAAATAPIDLAEAGPGLIERDLALEAPREYVSYSAGLVHAQVLLGEPERIRTVKVEVGGGNGAYTTEWGRGGRYSCPCAAGARRPSRLSWITVRFISTRPAASRGSTK